MFPYISLCEGGRKMKLPGKCFLCSWSFVHKGVDCSSADFASALGRWARGELCGELWEAAEKCTRSFPCQTWPAAIGASSEQPKQILKQELKREAHQSAGSQAPISWQMESWLLQARTKSLLKMSQMGSGLAFWRNGMLGGHGVEGIKKLGRSLKFTQLLMALSIHWKEDNKKLMVIKTPLKLRVKSNRVSLAFLKGELSAATKRQ